MNTFQQECRQFPHISYIYIYSNFSWQHRTIKLPSRDILGFSSFCFKTDSMSALSCLKITAIFTGACENSNVELLILLIIIKIKTILMTMTLRQILEHIGLERCNDAA